MKSFVLILFSLVLSLSPAHACLNFYHSIDKEGHLHEADEDEIFRGFNTNFNLGLIEKKLIKLEKGLKAEQDYQLLSDFAVLMLKAGKVKEALSVLEELYRHYPNEYQIAANLGTAYELNGNVEMAHQLISRGIELNPDSHGGSEWVHLKVLETKQHLADNPDYLSDHTVLGLTESNIKDDEIREQILIQVRERFPFSPGPNAIMASVLADLGDCFSQTFSIEYAKALYTIAKEYYGADETLMNEKIGEMVKLRRKYAGTKPERRHSEGDNIKLHGIRYKKLLDDNNPSGHIIDWDEITTDPDQLLKMAGIEKKIVPEDKDTTQLETVEEEVIAESEDPEVTSNNTIYIILIAVIVLIGVLIIFRRRQK